MNNQAFGEGGHQNPSGFISFTMSVPRSVCTAVSIPLKALFISTLQDPSELAPLEAQGGEENW